MSIRVTTGKDDRPPRASDFGVNAISRWSGSGERSSAYSQAKSGSDPAMLGADTIKFVPRDMVGGVSKKMYETDYSQRRVDAAQNWIPVIYGFGALVLFLGIMNFLNKK